MHVYTEVLNPASNTSKYIAIETVLCKICNEHQTIYMPSKTLDCKTDPVTHPHFVKATAKLHKSYLQHKDTE